MKIRACGLSKFVLYWISDFLRERQQFVKIGSARSQVVSLPSGVIQESLLGSLLFVIFINDLPDVRRTAVAMLYADDLKLSKAIN